MSNYDPFRIYARSHKASNKGQVLRKKYYPFLGNTFTQSDIQRVIDSLEQRGYTISPPGKSLSNNHFSHDLLYIFNVGTINFSSNEAHFSFHSLWEEVQPHFLSYLNVDPSSVSDFMFQVSVISIDCWGTMGHTPFVSNLTNSISLFFQDPGKAVTLTPHPPVPINPEKSHYFSIQSLDNNVALSTYIIYNEFNTNPLTFNQAIQKQESVNSSYLATFENVDPSLIPTLKDKDYSGFDPILYNFQLGGTAPPPFTIENSSALFYIQLQYDI